MRVYADGRVTLSVPLSWDRKDCEQHLLSREAKIHELLKSISYTPMREEEIERYTHLEEGQSIRIWGVEHPIAHEVRENAKPDAELVDGTIVLTLPENHTDAVRQEALEQLLRRELAEKVEVYRAEAEQKLGVETSGWSIRRMRSRWGSCRWETRRISINLELALHDPSMLEMACIHETAHILAHDHGKKFQSTMDAALPGWREKQKKLNQEGMRLQRWTPANERKFPDRAKNRTH
jgi:hypothetical protein